MADDWGDEVSAGIIPPKMAELPEIKLFGRWNCDDVQVSDMSLQVRIQICNQINCNTLMMNCILFF